MYIYPIDLHNHDRVKIVPWFPCSIVCKNKHKVIDVLLEDVLMTDSQGMLLRYSWLLPRFESVMQRFWCRLEERDSSNISAPAKENTFNVIQWFCFSILKIQETADIRLSLFDWQVMYFSAGMIEGKIFRLLLGLHMKQKHVPILHFGKLIMHSIH